MGFEGIPRYILHGDEELVVGLFDGIDDGQIGMVQLGGRFGFGAKTGQALAVVADGRGQHLEGHDAIEFGAMKPTVPTVSRRFESSVGMRALLAVSFMAPKSINTTRSRSMMTFSGLRSR